MSFCTKCGQEIVDGEMHICPAAQRSSWQAPSTEPYREPYPEDRVASSRTSADGKRIEFTIDQDQLKEKFRGFVDKIAPENNAAPDDDNSVFERGKQIVPDCVYANDGEVPVKQYNIARLRTRLTLSKAEGRMQITNKRVIFRAPGRSILGKTVLHEEFEIGEIAGLEMRDNPHFNFLNWFGGLLLISIFGGLGYAVSQLFIHSAEKESTLKFGLGVAAFFGLLVSVAWIILAVILRKRRAVKRYYSLRQMVLAFFTGQLLAYYLVGAFSYYMHDSINPPVVITLGSPLIICLLINWLVLSIVPNLIILVKTKGSFPGLQVERAGFKTLFLGRMDNNNSGFAEILPWEDTDRAIREAGAIIDDIQTMGDAAIAKWANK